MTLAADIANFLQGVSGTETVTYTEQPAGTTHTGITYALRRAISRREVLASEGYYTMQDTTWHLAANQVTWTPKEGDSITGADGVVWRVLDCALQTLSTRWRFTCRRAR